MGKHFDAMCRFVEGETDSEADQFKAKLRYASLVEFAESKPSQFFTPESLELFRLPWKAVVAEDPLSCVLLERAGKARSTRLVTDPATGLASISVKDRDLIFPDASSRSTTKDIGLRPGDVFTFGVVWIADPSTTTYSTFATFGQCVFGGTGDHMNGSGRVVNGALIFKFASYTAQFQMKDGSSRSMQNAASDAAYGKSVVDNLLTAFWQCVVMTQPSNWILRHDVKPLPKEPKKIRRTHQRPHWIVISDAERARAFREPSERVLATDEKRHITAHPRRAHYRKIGTLEDGSPDLTWVRACWVGSIEAEIRGGRYCVELGL